jgi:hypothetical protein
MAKKKTAEEKRKALARQLNAHKKNPHFQKGNKKGFQPIQAAALIGNKFYLRVSKHGRDKLFKSPKLLWEAAEEYFTHVDNNPWTKVEHKGSKAKAVNVNVRVPYTMEGLTNYLKCSINYFNTFERTISVDDPDREGFLYTINLIRQVVRENKLTGASAGFFKENVIMYWEGLRKDANVETEEQKSPEIKIEIADKKGKDVLEEVKKKLDQIDKE